MHYIPGSMPPDSKYLWEEGMSVKSFKLVENGIFQEEGQLNSCVDLLLTKLWWEICHPCFLLLMCMWRDDDVANKGASKRRKAYIEFNICRIQFYKYALCYYVPKSDTNRFGATLA